MITRQTYSEKPIPKEIEVKAAVIGAGMFGRVIVSQSQYVPDLRVSAVSDTDIAAAKHAFIFSGVAEDDICVTDSRVRAKAALEAGQRVVTPDAAILFEQDVDVIVEATGIPEAGAIHAQGAIAAGKHVAMVNKETDAAIGPILKYLADRAGVVYTAVDGDQHGLLIGMVRWARNLGLDVLCGGKALDADLLVQDSPPDVIQGSKPLDLTPEELAWFGLMDPGNVRETIGERTRLLGRIAGANPWDLVELTIAANATGLAPDVSRTHCPPVWAAEIPIALCPAELGGLLGQTPAIDCALILRSYRELSLMGGVFIVVGIKDALARDILVPQNCIRHPNGKTALIVRPHHMLGIDAIRSLRHAVVYRKATAAVEYFPRYDVVYRTTRGLSAGSAIGDDHSPDVVAEIVLSQSMAASTLLPAGLARGNRLVLDVPTGAIIGSDMVQPPDDSTLWRLRAQQDALFL